MTALAASDSILPETLEDLWDDELKALFGALPFKQQTFCLEYLEHGVGSRAYCKAYGIDPGPLAWSSASSLLRDKKVRAFITAYRAKDIFRHEDDKELIRATFRAGITDTEDHDTRIKAAQALAKLDGHNVAETVKHDATDGLRDFFGRLAMGQK